MAELLLAGDWLIMDAINNRTFLQYEGSAAPVPGQLRFRQRVVRGHGKAIIVLLGIVLVESVIASYVGMKYLSLGPLAVFDINFFRASLPLWFAIPLGWAGLVTYSLVKRKNEQPLKTFKRLIRFRSDWLVRGLLLFLCYLPLARAFGFVKASIPFINPFYLDPALIDLDIALLGTDAWRITHAIFPPQFLFAIDRLYAIWFTLLYLIIGWSSFNRDPRVQIQSAISLNLCWFLIGAVSATLLSSVGPCFLGHYFGNDHFEPLMVILRDTHEGTSGGLLSVRAMDYLIEHAGTGVFGAGISAMPSLHVAMCVFGVLLAFSTSKKIWLRALMVVYGLLIFIGSVHLGWHYLSDGLVSGAMTVLIWVGVGKLIDLLSGNVRTEISSA